MSFAVYSIQPFGNTVASTTVPLTLVLPSHSVVVTKLPAPNGFGKHNVSTHVVQIVSTIVSFGGTTVMMIVVVSQKPVVASHAITQIGDSVPATLPAVYVTQPLLSNTAVPNVPVSVPVLPSQ